MSITTTSPSPDSSSINDLGVASSTTSLVPTAKLDVDFTPARTRLEPCTLIFAGDMCTYTLAPTTRRILTKLVAILDRDVVLDLADVTFIDARGTTLFIVLRNELAQRGRTVRIARPATCVRRLLDICDLSELLITCVSGSADAKATSRAEQ